MAETWPSEKTISLFPLGERFPESNETTEGFIPQVKFNEHCMLFNGAGQRATTVPCGFSDTGLPIGLQIVGRPFNETMVLRIASKYEEANDWHLLSPPL